MRKMTEREKKLVEDNIMIVYGYIWEHHLENNMEKWEEIFLEMLCRAAVRYNPLNKQGAQFGTYAWKCLDGAFIRQVQYENCQCRKLSDDKKMIYIDSPHKDSCFDYEEVIGGVDVDYDSIAVNSIVEQFRKKLSKTEKLLFDEIYTNYKTRAEVMNENGWSRQHGNQTAERIKKKWIKFNGNEKLMGKPDE